MHTYIFYYFVICLGKGDISQPALLCPLYPTYIYGKAENMFMALGVFCLLLAFPEKPRISGISIIGLQSVHGI